MNGWRCSNCGGESHLATKINGVARSCMRCGYLGGMVPFEVELLNPAPPRPDDIRKGLDLALGASDRPKDKSGKYMPHLLTPSITEAIARVREYGVKKYHGEHGWKQQTPQDYIDAIGRHHDACRNHPEARDEESGLLHVCQIATDAMFVIQMLVDMGVDISYMKEPPKW